MKDKWGKVIERRNANQRAYTARNKDTINARLALKRADPEWREKHRAADRKYYWENREKAKDYQLRVKYGISLKEFQAMSAAQGGKCAICPREPRGTGKSLTLHVDHDHSTGAIRGLLCDQCNRGIGLLGDSSATLFKAAMYLAARETKRESA